MMLITLVIASFLVASTHQSILNKPMVINGQIRAQQQIAVPRHAVVDVAQPAKKFRPPFLKRLDGRELQKHAVVRPLDPRKPIKIEPKNVDESNVDVESVYRPAFMSRLDGRPFRNTLNFKGLDQLREEHALTEKEAEYDQKFAFIN